MTDSGGIERGIQPKTYNPHREYFGFPKQSDQPFPTDFRQRFQDSVANSYPTEAIKKLRDSGYDPLIIGYSHASRPELEAIRAKLTELKNAGGIKKALHEIDPQQLQHIKDFLAAEAEFKAKGIIRGMQARPDEAQRMQEYRRRLQNIHSENLSLWYLDHGVEVHSIEHPEVKRWIDEDKAKGFFGDEEETFGSARREDLQPFYTAIRRDIYGLQAIELERPDIVTVGSMHALKYDMLLNRSGQRTFYYQDRPFDWATIMKLWESMHRKFTK